MKYTLTTIATLAFINMVLFTAPERKFEPLSIRVDSGDDEPLLSNAALTGPNFFNLASRSIHNLGNRDLFIGDGTASTSANASVSFAVDSILQTVRFGGFTSCNLDTDGSGYLVCGTDATGGSAASGTIDMRDGYSGAYTNIGSVSFNTAHFGLNIGGTIASLSLDWGAGGPASLSQAETITGDWVNTTNPWADNEVADILTLTGSTITGGNNVRDTLTTTATLTIGDNGDAIIFSATNFDLDTNGLLTLTGASMSYGEFTVRASASAFLGTAFASVGDCNDSGEAIGWTTTGIFNCNASLQPLDATLTALAAYNTNGILTQTAADTFTGRTITGTTNQITVSNGDGVAGNPTLSIPTLLVGTGASFSYGEFTTQASASLFKGSAFSSVPSNECSDAEDTLNWENGAFSCGSDGGVTSGSNNEVLTDDGAGGSTSEPNLTFDGDLLYVDVKASIASALEVGGTASIGGNGGGLGVLRVVNNQGAIREALVMVRDSGTGGVSFVLDNNATGGRQWEFLATDAGNAEGRGKFIIFDGTSSTARMTFDGAGNASISANLDITGFASISNNSYLKIPYNTYSMTRAGQIIVNSASGSLDYYDGTNAIITPNEKCSLAITIAQPTSANDRWIDIGQLGNPAVLTKVTFFNASGSNAAKWNLYYGTPANVRSGTGTATKVFGTDRIASAGSITNYTNFSNSTLGDGHIIDVYISSTSATLEKFSFNYCWRYTH